MRYPLSHSRYLEGVCDDCDRFPVYVTNIPLPCVISLFCLLAMFVTDLYKELYAIVYSSSSPIQDLHQFSFAREDSILSVTTPLLRRCPHIHAHARNGI